MRLLVTTPLAIVVDEEDVIHVRAADETGFFGLQDRHADFVTATEVAVVSWRNRTGEERYCAAGRGVLAMRGGHDVQLATSEAVVGDDLDRLEHDVIATLRRRDEEERGSREEAARMQLAAIRQMFGALRPQGVGPRVSVPHEEEA